MVNKAEHSHASLMAMRLLHMCYGVALHEAERRAALHLLQHSGSFLCHIWYNFLPLPFPTGRILLVYLLPSSEIASF